MALSCFMRNALQTSRAKPVCLLSKFTPISSTIVSRLNTFTDDRSIVQKVKLQGIRGLSTSPIRLSQHGDHSKLWTIEKGVSAALLGILPVGFMYPSIVMDLLMAVSVVIHTHWGIEAIAVDYVRPIIFGNFIPKVALALVYVFSIATLVGLMNLIFNGPGLVNSIQTIWKL